MTFTKTDDPRSQVIQIRMTSSEKEELQNVSAATGIKISDLIRDALTEYYKELFPPDQL